MEVTYHYDMDPSTSPTFDTLVQRVQGLEDALRSHRHTGFDLTQKLVGTSVSRMIVTDNSFMGDGKTRSGTLTMQLAPNLGDVYIRAGLDAGDFANTSAKTGFILGIDDSDSDKAKFYFGSSTAYIQYDGSTLTVVGTITATSGTIGGFNIGADYIRDVANTFGLASTVTGGDDVRFWAGDTFANRATAPFRVTEAGAVTGSNFTHSGGLVTGVPITAIPNNTSTDISLLDFTQNLAFTSASATQINWSSGTIALSNGRTFSISSGNTGAMAAATYIYLDTAVSSTVLQITTTYSTAMGANKKLIATAQNNTTGASVIPFGGGQPLLDGAGNIVALSITAASIAASTITAAKISVSQLSAIAADLGTITAGVINLSTASANIHSGQSAYDTGTGFWLEYNSGTPRFSLGNSAGNKITWDGSTLSIVGISNVSKIFTAASSISANDAVYATMYQSDGGIVVDNSTAGEVTTNGSGNGTITFTVGNNANRVLVFAIFQRDSATGFTNVKYNAVAMTTVDSAVLGSGSGGGFISAYLVAPTAGANSLTFTVNATQKCYYAIWSLYNAKQSGQPDNHTYVDNAAASTSFSIALTPVLDGCLIFNAGFTEAPGPTITYTGDSAANNQHTGSGTRGYVFSGDSGVLGVPRVAKTFSGTFSSIRNLATMISIAPVTVPVAAVASTSASAAATANTFIGFASASATAGNTVSVFIGGEATGFSSLTHGGQYYLSNSTGAISLSAGSVTRKVGIATSSSTLLITNIW